MKILSIGNSFSQDAHKWLYTITGKKIKVQTFENYDTQILEKIICTVNKL